MDEMVGWITEWVVSEAEAEPTRPPDESTSVDDTPRQRVEDTPPAVENAGGRDYIRIGRTLDGGRSWTWNTTNYELRDIEPVSKDEAWAVASRKRQALLHTLDGGVSWQEVSLPQLPLAPPSALDLDGLFFLDSKHGWIIATEVARSETELTAEKDSLIVFRTADGGQTFEAARTPLIRLGNILPYRLTFRTPLEGWIAVGEDSLLHTTDGGKTWAVVAPVGANKRYEVRLFDCSFPTRDMGWAVGSRKVDDWPRAFAVRTDDGGKTWREVKTGGEGIKDSRLWQVVFVDPDHGWVHGEGGTTRPDLLPPWVPPHEISFILKYVPEGKPRRGGKPVED